MKYKNKTSGDSVLCTRHVMHVIQQRGGIRGERTRRCGEPQRGAAQGKSRKHHKHCDITDRLDGQYFPHTEQFVLI